VLNWERLRKGTAISYEAVKTVYRYLDTEAVERGHKTFKHGDPTLLYGMQELQSKYGLKTNLIWHQALTKIADDKRDYLISVLKRGGNFSDMRRVRLSTIHGAKGGEADNVLLLMDLSPKFAKEYAHNSDNIHRLFYVGVTRAKQSLHLVMPQKIEKGFRL
jgi:superfamily I DNA/RNA helicase